ncbi:ABC transporter substrate-binding protein [Brevibacterium aurantiacum]|uniref:ABC transporter substrate-binding protein n=1 Tax=Brevibacterium aurantiacum TaxID=273384 RepID=UPI0016426125|nr:ABC transporter substrate-binding protein [Brevibacterium aurantiacum]
MLFAACSSGTSGSATTTDDGSAPDGSFPVTVDHAYGSTTIEEEPKKIITLGLSDQDPLLALGVAPLAVSPWWGDYEYATWPWAQDELGGVQPTVLNGGVRDDSNPPVEEIAELEPDLIISLYSGTTKEQFGQLSKIAPVIVPDKGYTNFTITWQEATRATGEALGREDEALELVNDLEASFADAAKDHPEFEGKQAIVAERFKAGETIVRTGNDVRAQFFSQLGFTVADQVAELTPNDAGEIYVPDERIDEISKDLLVWNVGFNPEVRKTVENLGLYNDLRVVKDRNAIWVEDEVVSGAFTWGTVLSLDYALDEMLPQISEAMN